MSTDVKVTPRLKAQYREEIVPALTTEFQFANAMQVPGLTKIVVNMGVGKLELSCKRRNDFLTVLSL